VITELTNRLAEMQRTEGASPQYFVTLSVVKPPLAESAHTNGSSKILLGILGLAVFLLFAVVAIGDAVRLARRGSAPNRVAPEPTLQSDSGVEERRVGV
jgi:hypothetical protein